jgi:diguanylate cyclase (GGDEF)-like protein
MMSSSFRQSRHESESLCNDDADILIVDDDPATLQLLSRILSDVGRIHLATNGTDALRIASSDPPDIILLDAEMPGISGFKVLEALKAEPGLADVPVVFITSHGEAGFEVSALELGAVDYIGKPFKSSIVLARIKTHLSLKLMADSLRRDTLTDCLTGIPNRRHFDQALEREWLSARRAGDPVSLLMIDVDHFKLYNDRYGHPKGDAALRQLAQVLLGVARRPADLVARCGGEEFVVLLPRTTRRGAENVARRVLEAVESMGIVHGDSPAQTHHLTVSIGIACHDEESPHWPDTAAKRRIGDDAHADNDGIDLVLAADRALYLAKRTGRARAVLRDVSDVDIPEGEVADAPSHPNSH